MKTRKPQVHRRGQATVEMAVVMVALVPTFLYLLTADDLLRYRLNLQEVVVASPWDYAHLDYERPQGVPGNALEGRLRQTYENVNIGYSADSVPASNEERTASMTFAGWNVQGSERIRCMKNGDFAAGGFPRPIADLVGKANRGGLYRCNAALAVSNVRLIREFFQHWAGNVQVTDKTPGSTQSAWGLNRQHFSIMADTWAMTEVQNVNPVNRNGVLYNRVNSVYRGMSFRYTFATMSAQLFVFSAVQILNPFALLSDGASGDNTKTPEVGFSNAARPSVNFNNNAPFDSSPWRSKGAGNETYEQVYNIRASHYMGLRLSP